MKKFLTITILRPLLLLWLTASLVACSSDMMGDPMAGEGGGYVTTFGEIFGEEMRVVTDDGQELTICQVGAGISWDEVCAKSGRVLFNYTAVEYDNARNMVVGIRINRFYDLVEKEVEIYEPEGACGVVTRSAGYEGGFDVNNNPNFVPLLGALAMPFEVGVGGGYINVYVLYYSTTEEYVPEVSLVWDVATSTENTALFQLVSEADEEADKEGAQVRYLWHTFRVGEEIAERIQDVNNYAFYWRWWANEKHPEEGTKNYTSLMTDPQL
ncbi:MAG: hypothetical protein J6U53_05585 [Tidjanibacter sp.]|nr:hypothetical protein [Tidjanibacter sp.]